ncbi:MAG: elongation factor P [bacterium]|jgi:elongation factor P|nr:elongation factor P [bacterium]
MNISTADFSTGITLDFDGKLFKLVDFQHVKPGKGAAFVRTKLKNRKTGQVLERKFRAGEKMKQAIIDTKTSQYLYNDGSQYCFMDNETFEQIFLSPAVLEDECQYLKENIEVKLQFYEDRIIGVELPTFVELEVTSTIPGVKGDTVSGGSKPATLETGLTVNVPLFINEGDVLKIDTRKSSYVERMAK